MRFKIIIMLWVVVSGRSKFYLRGLVVIGGDVPIYAPARMFDSECSLDMVPDVHEPRFRSLERRARALEKMERLAIE